jgi:hypothetical protein
LTRLDNDERHRYDLRAVEIGLHPTHAAFHRNGMMRITWLSVF